MLAEDQIMTLLFPVLRFEVPIIQLPVYQLLGFIPGNPRRPYSL